MRGQMLNEIKPLNNSPLRKLEIRLTKKLSAFVPPFMGTKLLTFLNLLSSFLILAAYYFSKRTPFFLFFASLFILTQWIFDCLDGSIGRLRREGFVRWGFYMDHLFDYFFMTSIVFGLSFLFPMLRLQMLFLFFISSAFMISFFLMHDAMKDKEINFNISFLGFSPIEFRLVMITFNILFYFFTDLINYFISKYLFSINILLLALLFIVIYSSQKKLSALDIYEKPK